MSSARVVRCRLKCHNERNPCCQLLTGDAEDSDKTGNQIAAEADPAKRSEVLKQLQELEQENLYKLPLLRFLLCINLTGTVMRAGYCRKEQWNQAKRMNRQHCGK